MTDEEQSRNEVVEQPLSYAPTGRFAWLFNFIGARPWAIIAVFSIAVVISLVALLDLRFHSSSETYANSNDPALLAFREHQELFSGDDPIFVASIGAESVYSVERLKRLEALHRALSDLEGVAETYSLIDCGYATNADGAIEVGRLIEDVPRTDAGVAALHDAVESSPPIRNSLVSPDRRTAIVVVVPETDVGDPLARPADLVDRIDALREQHSGPEQIAVAGHPYTASVVGMTSRNDVFLFAPITTVILIILLSLMYRNIWAAVIPLLTATAVSAIVLGIQVSRGKELSEMDAMLPTLFTAIGVAYSMHLLDRYAEGVGSARSRTKASIEKVALPLVVSGVTTAAGFSALITSTVEGTQSFGMLGALGVLLTTLAVLLMVPALLIVIGPNLSRASHDSMTAKFLGALRRSVREAPALTVVAFIVLCGAAAMGASRVTVDNSPTGWLPASHPAREDITALQRAGIGTTLVYLTLDSGESDGAVTPDFLKRTRRLADHLESAADISSAMSLEPFIRNLHQVASGNRDAGIPDNPNLISQYMLLYESSESASQIDDFVDFDRRRLSMVLRTNAQRSSEWWPLKGRISKLIGKEFPGSEYSIAGPFPMMFESGDDIAPEQVRSLGTALLIIALTLILVLRSFRWGLLAIPSNVIPILVLFGIMGWANVNLDIISAIIACTTLGIIVDDSVHFLVSYREALHASDSPEYATNEAFRIAGRPIFFTTVALAGSFLVFLASSFQSIVQVGFLATSGIVVALFADLLLLPILLRWLAPRGVPDRASSRP